MGRASENFWSLEINFGKLLLVSFLRPPGLEVLGALNFSPLDNFHPAPSWRPGIWDTASCVYFLFVLNIVIRSFIEELYGPTCLLSIVFAGTIR